MPSSLVYISALGVGKWRHLSTIHVDTMSGFDSDGGWDSLVPGPLPVFSMLHAEKRATLKNWEWPGDEARSGTHDRTGCSLFNYPSLLTYVTSPSGPLSSFLS